MEHLPALKPLAYIGNIESKVTLHLFLQIIGKIKLGKTPRKNHWWYITIYVDTNGFTTGPIPFQNDFNTFKITINVVKNQLEVENSNGDFDSFVLENGLSVGDFYLKLTEILDRQKIEFTIIDKPFDLNIKNRFREITNYHHYKSDYVNSLWMVMRWTANVFEEFSGRFYGKTCPVHIYWHSMDLAVTRFSGKKAPQMPKEARLSDKDAYSHEVISFGFWPGDNNTPEPAFYSYTYPSPINLEKEIIKPAAAIWVDVNNSPMAILKYNDLIKYDDPKTELLAFMESTYLAGAKLANWDIDHLKVPDLKEL